MNDHDQEHAAANKLAQRLVDAWRSSGGALLLHAASEIDRLNQALVRERADSQRLAKRNALLVIELETLQTALGIGTADEHHSRGLE